MRKIMYNRALFILHKTPNPYMFTVSQKKKYLVHNQKKSFRGFENAALHNHCSFCAKTENFGFVLFHPNINTTKQPGCTTT